MSFNIIKDKGQGGFGLVQVIEKGFGDFYALKTFCINSLMNLSVELTNNAKKRFIKEAKYQKSIRHPNIVPVFEILEQEPPAYIMPLAESSMYDDMVSGFLNSTNFNMCLFDIMAGLEEIHSVGIYHRDLKPANVLRFKKDDKFYYAIGDFGLMSLNQTGFSTLTQPGMAKTSDLYTAPEITQDLNYASIQSDIFSLGCILHDFVRQSSRIPCNEINESSEYGDILLGATRKNRSRRFKDVASFREALITITSTPIDIKTQAAETVLESLTKDINEFNHKDILSLSDFLNSNINESEKTGILNKITLDHISKITSVDLISSYIGKVYCEYARNGSFSFDYCDTLSNRVEQFMKNAEIDLMAEGIFALLYMGTDHNRWYVERKSAKYFMGEINENLLKRICMEIRVDGPKFCRAIDHLFHSIGYSIGLLHPEIQKTIKEVCK